jgi:hypothetical protein
MYLFYSTDKYKPLTFPHEKSQGFGIKLFGGKPLFFVKQIALQQMRFISLPPDLPS